MIAAFPTARDGISDPRALEDAGNLMAVITAVRTIRAEYNVAPSRPVTLNVRTDSEPLRELLGRTAPLLSALARIESLTIQDTGSSRPHGCATAVAAGAELLVPLREIIDVAAERTRLIKEKARCEKDFQAADRKLTNEKFIGKAPKEVIEKETMRRQEAATRMQKIDEALEGLSTMEAPAQ